MELTIKQDKDQKKFFAIVEGKECFLQYAMLNDKTLDYKYTFVPPELRGQQIAEKIVLYALEYAKNNQYHVKPTCSFVKKIIERHPEYKYLTEK